MAELQRVKECAEAVEYKVWYYEKANETGTTGYRMLHWQQKFIYDRTITFVIS